MLRLASDADVHGGILHGLHRLRIEKLFHGRRLWPLLCASRLHRREGIETAGGGGRRSRQHGPPDREVNGNIETAGGGSRRSRLGSLLPASSPGAD